MEVKAGRLSTGGGLMIKNCSRFTVHCLLLTILIPTTLPAQTIEEIADKVQENYENTHDLEATFIQESLIKMMDTIEKADGKVYIKKPGMIRWDYRRPKKQEIVIDGKTLWIYRPEEREVIKAPFSEAPQNITQATFLYGVGKLKDYFEISLSNPPTFPLVKSGNGRIITLELIPKGVKGNIEKIFLGVDLTDYTIRGFSLFDIYGNKTTITFKNIKINKGLKDSIFHLTIPKGVKIIEP